MRKRFLVLASVATMALAGTTMPAFAADGTTTTTTATSTTARISCTVTVTSSTGTVQTYTTPTVSVSSQLASQLLNPPTYSYTNPLTKVTYTVSASCHLV